MAECADPVPLEAKSAETLVAAADDEELRALLRENPESRGHAVTAVGDEVLDCLRGDASYDLIVLDAIMPGRDELSVLRALQDSEERSPAVLMTAYEPLRLRVRALEPGAMTLLEKPFSIEALDDALGQVLEAPARKWGRG